jgi:ribosomal protein L16/L10AE
MPTKPIENKPMRTKAQVALTALEQALKITGVQAPKRDDEFTAAEYADKAEMHIEAARRLLNRHVKDGRLVLRKTPKGHFYSIV